MDEGEVSVCYIVNTCEYCADILPQLETTVKSRVDAMYKDDIDLHVEQNTFHDIITIAIRVSSRH